MTKEIEKLEWQAEQIREILSDYEDGLTELNEDDVRELLDELSDIETKTAKFEK